MLDRNEKYRKNKESKKPKSNKNNLRIKMLDTIKNYNIKLDLRGKDQHLIISSDAINQLINSAELQTNDVVLEIGPGPGQITEAIAQKAGKVYAIEIDTQFKPILKNLERKYENLEVIFASVLNTRWPVVNKIVSNPPYAILEPLLKILIKKRGIRSSSFIIGKKY